MESGVIKVHNMQAEILCIGVDFTIDSDLEGVDGVN